MSEMLDNAVEMEQENVQEMYTLKHNGKLYEVGYDELIALAQKGMDYDRIRADRDECRRKLAAEEEARMSESKFEDDLPSNLGESDVAAEMPAESEQAKAGGVENPEAGSEMWREGFAQLLRVYPEVSRYHNFEALPEGFVEGLAQGLSPVVAWQRYLLDRQKLKLAMMDRENSNRLAAAPDVRSSGRYDEDGFVKALFGR